MKGYPDVSIKGNDEIKRSEAATVIYRILSNDYIDSIKIKESNYIDIGKDDWYKEYMDFLYSADIIKGYPDGEFKPDEKISRAEAVNMLFYLDETHL